MLYICETCNKQYKNKISLKNHKNRNECEKYNKLQFKCKNCYKRYSSKKALLKHMKDKHSIEQNVKKKCTNHKCPLCNKTFSCKSNLNRHLSKGYCPMIEKNSNNVSVMNNSNNDNSVNINNNINNNINIHINFGKEKLDDWINEVGNKIIDKCIRNLQELPCNLLEAKHVLAKQNRNIYLESEEDKYKDINIYSDGWKKMNTSSVLAKMIHSCGDDIFDLITNDKKYKLRISKKLKEALDKKITTIQSDEFLKGPVVNMLLKNKNILKEHFDKTQTIEE